MKNITRRQVIQKTALSGLAWGLGGCMGESGSSSSTSSSGSSSSNSSSSSSSTSTSSSSSSGEPKPNTFRLIDTHVHYFDVNSNGGSTWPPSDSTLGKRYAGGGNLPKDMPRLVAPYEFAGSIFVEHTQTLAGNDWMADLSQSSNLCSGVVMAMLPNASGFQKQLESYADKHFLKGLRLRSINGVNVQSMAVGRILDLMADKQLSLEMSINSDAAADIFFEIASTYPTIRCFISHTGIASHTGNAPPKAYRDRMLRFKAMPNVSVKCTSLSQFASSQNGSDKIAYYKPVIEFIEMHYGIDRMLFGGNFPNSKETSFYKKDIDLWRAYFANRASAADLFFYENAKRDYLIA